VFGLISRYPAWITTFHREKVSFLCRCGREFGNSWKVFFPSFLLVGGSIETSGRGTIVELRLRNNPLNQLISRLFSILKKSHYFSCFLGKEGGNFIVERVKGGITLERQQSVRGIGYYLLHIL
jgi:hypothetical protein